MLYTIGHSNHTITAFIDLLRHYEITALGDVRSQPHSRHTPQFSQTLLKTSLAEAGITYVFLGKELGARSTNPACYQNGKVQYDRLAVEPSFINGLQRIKHGMERFCLVLMCAEKDPLDCHRALLIARTLHTAGFAVSHIHANATLESQYDMENRLLALCHLPEKDMFQGRDELLNQAYAIQAARVAYCNETMNQSERDVAA